MQFIVTNKIRFVHKNIDCLFSHDNGLIYPAVWIDTHRREHSINSLCYIPVQTNFANPERTVILPSIIFAHQPASMSGLE